jgi:hypothetical protein
VHQNIREDPKKHGRRPTNKERTWNGFWPISKGKEKDDQELRDLCSLQYIIHVIKRRWMRWTERVANTGLKRNTNTVLVRKTWWQNITWKAYAEEEVIEINVKAVSVGVK